MSKVASSKVKIVKMHGKLYLPLPSNIAKTLGVKETDELDVISSEQGVLYKKPEIGMVIIRERGQ